MRRLNNLCRVALAIMALICMTAGVVSAGMLTGSITYQGKLTDAAGNPLTGTNSVKFSIYDTETGGTAIVSSTKSVSCENGLFTTPVTFAQPFFDGQALWLGVKVGSDPEMTPRQEIRPVPYALSLRPGAWVTGHTASPVLNLLNMGGGTVLNISTTSDDSSGATIKTTGDASHALSILTGGDGSAGVSLQTYGAASHGIIGGTSGPESAGAYFLTTGAGSPAFRAYTQGASSDGVSVRTTGSNSNGIYIVTTAKGSDGVNVSTTADGSSGVSLSMRGDDSYGVYTVMEGADSTGVYARTIGGNSPAVSASTTGASSDGISVRATGINSNGIRVVTTADRSDGVNVSTAGDNSFGVNTVVWDDGSIGLKAGAYGDSSHGVDVDTWGVESDGVNIFTREEGSRGVYAQTMGYQSDGIVGVTTGRNSDGVFGYATDFMSYGVYARSQNYDAIYANTDNSTRYGLYTPDKIRAAGSDFPSSDVAEYMPAVQDAGPGTVLVIGDSGSLEPASAPYDTRVAGIVSTEPGVTLGAHDEGNPGEALVAVAGRVPCKADASYGAIRAGDLLTTSATPGHAMKAADPRIGTVLGKAMETLESGTGTIEVLVTLQ